MRYAHHTGVLGLLLLGSSSPAAAQQFLVEKILRRPGLPLHAAALAPTSNGEFVAMAPAGPLAASSSVPYTYVARLTADADTLWQRWLPQTTEHSLCAVTADAGGLWALTHDAAPPPGFQRPRLQRLSPNGRLWRTTYPPPAAGRRELLTMLYPHPTGGCFAVGWNESTTTAEPRRQVILSLDSLGQPRWRRDLRGSPNDHAAAFCYTRAGTLLLAGYGNRYFQPGPPYPQIQTKLTEVDAIRGDSLRGRFYVMHPPGGGNEAMYALSDKPWRVVALADGGFLYSGTVSLPSAVTTSFLAKVDANLNVVWRYLYPVPAAPPYGTQYPVFLQPHALADGSLLVLARSDNPYGLPQQPFWLYHFSPAGAVLGTYSFSPARPAGGGFVRVNHLLPVAADSSWLVAGEAGTSTGQPDGLYVARLRVPGLRRATPTAFAPATVTASAPAAAARGAALAVFPNPAGGTATVRYALPPGVAQATLAVHNALGQPVATLALSPAQQQARLPVAALPAGVYLCRLLVQGRVRATQRLAVTH